VKLNLDCIRDILLVVEEDQTMEHKFDFDSNCEDSSEYTGFVKTIYSDQLLKHERLKMYSAADILYSIKQMGENGLLDIDDETLLGDDCITYGIRDITPYGHEFISNIRNSTIWNKVKTSVKSVSGASIPVILNVAAELILKQLLQH